MSDSTTAPATDQLESALHPEQATDGEEDIKTLLRGARKSRSRLTIPLGVAAIAMVGFVAGIQVEKLASPDTAGQPAAAGEATGASREPGLVDARALPGASGSVKFVDGSTIYVTDMSGTTVKVRTSRRSRFTKPARGSLRDVSPGARVVVRGPRASDGSVGASSVTISRGSSSP